MAQDFNEKPFGLSSITINEEGEEPIVFDGGDYDSTLPLVPDLEIYNSDEEEKEIDIEVKLKDGSSIIVWAKEREAIGWYLGMEKEVYARPDESVMERIKELGWKEGSKIKLSGGKRKASDFE